MLVAEVPQRAKAGRLQVQSGRLVAASPEAASMELVQVVAASLELVRVVAALGVVRLAVVRPLP